MRKKLFAFLFLLLFLFAGPGTSAQERKMDLGVRCPSTDFLSRIDGEGEAVITNPATLKSAGLESAQVGDRLLITRIANDALQVQNLRSGATIKFGYEYGEGVGSSSGYLSRISLERRQALPFQENHLTVGRALVAPGEEARVRSFGCS